MAAILLVRGEIRYGEWRGFVDAVVKFREYRARKNYAVPELLEGMTGPMNTAVLLFRYKDAKDYEDEERAVSADPEYAKVASDMPYREGSIVKELFRAA